MESSIQDWPKVSGDWICGHSNYLIYESLDVKGDLFPMESSM